MPEQSSNPFQFWQELKRRKVILVIPVYAAAAFVLLELVDIIAEPFGLPDWTLKLVFVLLCIGLIISIIFSWIYDITPEGVRKTRSVQKTAGQIKETPSRARGWQIATYTSIVVIVGLLILNIIGNNKPTKIYTSLEKSIAVLPFQNFSGEADQDFMCLGLTDEIINHLYKIESFDKVVSLTSVLNYRDPERNTPEIAKELGVNYILEGTYKKIGEDVRVRAQLIEPGSDRHIWIHEYNRPYEEIISIQSDIALQIANHIKAFLTVSEKQNIQEIPTTNQEAYELIQQALYLSNTKKYTSFDQLADLALKAIELDPKYADAYAWAGLFTYFKGAYIGESEVQSVVWDALTYYNKALELNPNNASAHLGLATFNELTKWDYIKAEQEYLKGKELEPNNLKINNQYREFLVKMNRLEDALSYFDTMIPSSDLIRIQILSGNKKEAYNSINAYLKVNGEHAFRWVGACYIWLEEYDSAKFYLQSAMKYEDPQMLVSRFQACLALMYQKSNNHQPAQNIINQLIDRSKETTAGSPGYFIGWYYSGIGEADSAFIWLEKAYQNRSMEIPWLKADPVFKNLKDDDRYWDLYERAGHKAYDEYMASKKK